MCTIYLNPLDPRHVVLTFAHTTLHVINMDFTSTANMTFMAPDALQAPVLPGYLNLDKVHSPATLSLTAIATVLVSILAWAFHKPAVHELSPAFASDTLPIIGAFGFLTRNW